jgi:hypothetical protein
MYSGGIIFRCKVVRLTFHLVACALPAPAVISHDGYVTSRPGTSERELLDGTF